MKKGIPNQIRGEMWKKLLNTQSVMAELESTYRGISSSQSPALRQIKADIPKIFPTHTCYSVENSPRFV